MSRFNDHLLKELKDPKIAVEFILDALEDPGDNFSDLMTALRQVAKAHGMPALVECSGLGKSTVYNMIQKDSNPTLKNALKLINAMGMTLSVDVKYDVKPKPANVLDVAEYVLKHSRCAKTETTWWLQKIVYYANSESLANFDIPLFHQPIEAWANGPVVRELYDKHKGTKSLNCIFSFGDENNLSQKQKLAIDWAIYKYGGSTGEVLSQLTHAQAPWKNARGRIPEGAYCDAVISNDDIKYFHKNIHYYEDDYE